MSADANSHDSWRDSAALYALDALTGEERRAFETHLQSCAECAVELLNLRPASDALAQVVPQLDPPFALKERVVTAATGQPEQVSSPSNVTPITAAPATLRPKAKSDSTFRWLSLAAMLLITVGLAGYANSLRGRVANLESQLNSALAQSASLQARVDATERTLATTKTTLTTTQTQLDVLTAADATRIALAGQKIAPEASGRADWSPSRGLALSVANLPPLQPRRVYQVWLLTSGVPVSVGFVDDPSGKPFAIFPAPAGVQPIGVALSEEPQGGSTNPAGPSGPVYIAGTMRRAG
jgi:anti-sigma-K factor RskA